MPRHLRWPRLGMLCTKCATMKPMSPLKMTAGVGEMQGWRTTNQERLALEQEQEIAEADEALHRLVQRGEMDGVEGGVEDEKRDQEDERKRHQKRDGRFAPHRGAKREAPAAAACHRKRFHCRVDHA